jgi:uncharacterized protein YfcZ (UPF0381/DUF406 family)
MTEGELQNLIASTSVLVAAIGLGFIFSQLRQTRKIHEIDSYRSKIENTLSAYEKFRADMRSKKGKIKERFSLGPNKASLSDEDVSRIWLEKYCADDVNEILDTLNRLAVGVEKGAYDFQLLSDLSGVQFVKTFSRMQPYVARLQRDVSPHVYGHLDSFVRKLEAARRAAIESESVQPTNVVAPVRASSSG